ncbi:Signal transduction response regulator, receiver domain, partial [Sesbania bispinosa]
MEVTATSNTPTAASMILEDKGRFKMIMTKLNMPGVDAVSFVHLVLGKRIPVIFMYSGGFDDVTDEKALASESCYFIEEPIMLCDLKCILQDMYQSSKLIYKESQDITAEGSPQPQAQHANDTEVDGEIRNHGKGKGKVDHNKKMGGDSLVGAREGLHRSQGGGRVCEHSTYPTRPPSWLWKHSVPQMNLFSQNFRDSLFGDKKRLWTPELHLKFEEAVRHLGENARPKAILYMMNDASLTIRQVASHYQKYKSRMKHTENDSRKSDSGAVKTSSCSSVKAKFRSPPEGSSTGSAQ